MSPLSLPILGPSMTTSITVRLESMESTVVEKEVSVSWPSHPLRVRFTRVRSAPFHSSTFA